MRATKWQGPASRGVGWAVGVAGPVPERGAAARPGAGEHGVPGPGPRGVALYGPTGSLPSGGRELIGHSTPGPTRTVPAGREATESADLEMSLSEHIL